jgi:hypothetical protein
MLAAVEAGILDCFISRVLHNQMNIGKTWCGGLRVERLVLSDGTDEMNLGQTSAQR